MQRLLPALTETKCLVALFLLCASVLRCESGAMAQETVASGKTIKALLVTGGCCHDYDRQKLILPRGISARAQVEWTVIHQGGTTTTAEIPLYQDPHWADGFDVIVHNECFSDAKDPAWLARILAPHRQGKPAVLIHCAMHCYRVPNDEWFEFCGLQSPNHGPHYAYTVQNIAPQHPIMRGFGESWQVPKGELYNSQRLFPTARALARAARQEDGQPQVCVWTNDYRGTRVFATTIGHYNETMAEPTYLDMVTRGLLWAVHGEAAPEIRQPTTAEHQAMRTLLTQTSPGVASPAGTCCNQGNLAFQVAATASSEETGKQNFAKHAVDGDLKTRWCAADSSSGQWLQLDLGKVQPISAVRLHWEQPNNAYRYQIEGSVDREQWLKLVDAAKNRKNERIASHSFDAQDVRYVRVTFLGSKSGSWGSLWEVEVAEKELPALPEGVQDTGTGQASVADVTAPAEFDVRIFAAPPEVNYPVCLTAAPTGEVFVGIDEQGSLGKETGRGRIVRCIDQDGDGVADRFNTFAKIDHPRGLIFDQNRLWVLHPPSLSLLVDQDGDGQADQQQTLISGISTAQVNQRGADHTTNGIRMGIDGWIYIAVGDFGFVDARGTDGRTLSRRGGGIVRVRPDGTDMEVFAWGLRNILDVCIDPYLNMFTRDNTNDGGGWNVRVTHILQGADYGYPSKYLNFADEIMPPLADYGGGSGCGAMFVHEPRWPASYSSAAYTCDWGTSRVMRHLSQPVGATFRPNQEVFLSLPRPTDIDIDGSGRMYVSSWKNGSFNFSDPNVGFVARVVPRDFLPKPFPQLRDLSLTELLSWFSSGNAVHTLHTQQECLRRAALGSAERAEISTALWQLVGDQQLTSAGRIAALFTIKQIEGAGANPTLMALAERDVDLREFALRALTDRLGQTDNITAAWLVRFLQDPAPRVRAQTLIGLSRLAQAGRIQDAASVANAILPLSVVRSADGQTRIKVPAHDEADPERVLPHLAVRALRDTHATAVLLSALDSPYASGASWTLREMHDPQVVDTLVARLAMASDFQQKLPLIDLLARLYHREGEYSRGDWWGTRPDTAGPHYDRTTWEGSPRIAEVLTSQLASVRDDSAATEQLQQVFSRYRLPLAQTKTNMQTKEPQAAVVAKQADPNNPNQIGNLSYADVLPRAATAEGKPRRGQRVFESVGCNACHTSAAGQTPKGPHLVDIGKRYKRVELIESILKPSEKLAQGFDSWSILTSDGKVVVGFVALESAETLQLRQANGLVVEIPKDEIESRKKLEQSMMPTGLVDSLTPEQLADLVAYLESLH